MTIRGHTMSFRNFICAIKTEKALAIFAFDGGKVHYASEKLGSNNSLADERIASGYFGLNHTTLELNHDFPTLRHAALKELEAEGGPTHDEMVSRMHKTLAELFTATKSSFYSTPEGKGYKFAELYGVDMMIRHDGQPIVLELNRQADLNFYKYDGPIKLPMGTGFLCLAGVLPAVECRIECPPPRLGQMCEPLDYWKLIHTITH